MYLSHERGQRGGHHRFITEKRVFANWAQTFNIHFHQPDWTAQNSTSSSVIRGSWHWCGVSGSLATLAHSKEAWSWVSHVLFLLSGWRHYGLISCQSGQADRQLLLQRALPCEVWVIHSAGGVTAKRLSAATSGRSAKAVTGKEKQRCVLCSLFTSCHVTVMLIYEINRDSLPGILIGKLLVETGQAVVFGLQQTIAWPVA